MKPPGFQEPSGGTWTAGMRRCLEKLRWFKTAAAPCYLQDLREEDLEVASKELNFMVFDRILLDLAWLLGPKAAQKLDPSVGACLLSCCRGAGGG